MKNASGGGSRETTKGAGRAHRANLYETPPEALPALLAAERLPHVLWEPAAGRGALVLPLRAAGHAVCATDLNSWLCPEDRVNLVIMPGVDFLMETRAPKGVEAIITNPPFNIASRFVEHATLLCDRVYMLLRLAFLEGGTGRSAEQLARERLLDGERRPRRAYVFRRRLPMMHRDGWEGRKANSGMAMAWFAWDGPYTGPCEVHRISWHGDKQQANPDDETDADDEESEV